MYWFLLGMLKNSMQKYFFFDRFNLNFMQGFLSSSLFNFLYEPVALFGRKLEKCFLTEEENIFKRVRRFLFGGIIHYIQNVHEFDSVVGKQETIFFPLYIFDFKYS